MSGLPSPFLSPDPDFLEDLGLATRPLFVPPPLPQTASPTPQPAPRGWRIERRTYGTGAYDGDWQPLPPWPFRVLSDAIRIVQPGDRIVNVVTGRVVIEL